MNDEAHLTLMLEHSTSLTGERKLLPMIFIVTDEGISFYHSPSGGKILMTLSDLGKLTNGLEQFRKWKKNS